MFLKKSAENREPNAAETILIAEADKALEKFNAAMADDLNTADTLGALFELVREIFKLPQTGVSMQAIEYAQKTMLRMTDILGLLMKKTDDIPPEITEMLKEREAARKEKNWKRSDELRDAVTAAGVYPGGYSCRPESPKELMTRRTWGGLLFSAAHDRCRDTVTFSLEQRRDSNLSPGFHKTSGQHGIVSLAKRNGERQYGRF